MCKRASLARAIALDPDMIFFDEPSAGFDPINARKLDDLILELRDGLGATFVVVTHELASIFAIGNNSVFLDETSKTMIATGNPKELLANSKDPRVMQFLTRGKQTMSKKVNKTVIGVFVIGALVLLLVAIVVFGSGELFKRTNKFVLYFDGSVKGLSIGAPVMFRGVSIGTVKDISLIYDSKAGTVMLPVIVEIQQGRIKGTPSFSDLVADKKMIELGLRGKLEVQSFLTGQLMIAFDFYPNQPAKLRGILKGILSCRHFLLLRIFLRLWMKYRSKILRKISMMPPKGSINWSIQAKYQEVFMICRIRFRRQKRPCIQSVYLPNILSSIRKAY